MSQQSPTPGPIHAPRGYGFPTSTEHMLRWSRVDNLLSKARTYWLGTVLPNGKPYATPLWAVWVDNAVYFDGMPSTRWARNLRAKPAIEMHVELEGVATMLSGTAEVVVTDAAAGARIAHAWDEKYGKGTPEPVHRGLFRLRPSVVRAWSESMADGARWSFGDGTT